MNYKVISAILGLISLGCILQAIGILPEIINWINNLPHMVGG